MRETIYSNPDKRTVVCVIDNCELDVIDRVRKVLRVNDPKKLFHFRGQESYLIGPFRGVAKCHPDDEFDFNTGVQLAQERARRVYQRAFNREILTLTETLDTLSSELEDLYDYNADY